MKSRQTEHQKVLQQIMQVLGPSAVCECDGCAWETNEAIRLLNSIGIVYQPRGAAYAKHRHNVEAERRGNVMDATNAPVNKLNNPLPGDRE